MQFYNSVYVLKSILHCFQYRSNKDAVHAVVEHFYPFILQWVQGVMVSSSILDEEGVMNRASQ